MRKTQNKQMPGGDTPAPGAGQKKQMPDGHMPDTGAGQNQQTPDGHMPDPGAGQKKILILTTVSGFLQKFESGDVRLLQEAGYEVHYAANPETPVYTDRDDAGIPPGVIFHPVPIDKSPYHVLYIRRALRQLTELIRREHIGTIHCHTPVGGLLGRLAGHRCGCRVIYTAHGFHFYHGAPVLDNLLYKTAERRLAHYTDVLVVINREDYESARQFRLKPGGEVIQIPGTGLDLAAFSPPSDEERGAARQRLGLSEEEYFLLSAGELNHNKNHRTLLAALAMLPESKGTGAGSRIRCGICGDGPDRERLQEEIRDLKLQDTVTLYGYVSPIREMLAAADAFLFPSRREGLGMAALEALAMGIPVIAADNRGTREYMQDGINGYTCRWDAAEEYAEAIARLRALSGQELAAMRQEAIQTAKRFSADRTMGIMREVYRIS